MKFLLSALVIAIFGVSMFGSDRYEYNDYYFQRKSLFEILPVDSNDIVFVGNSLTNNGDWHEIFNNPTVKNRGISSDVIQGVSDRIDLITKGSPKKIFLLVGVNDISHKLDADSIVTALEKLVLKIKRQSPNSKLYLQSLLPINNDFGRYRNLKGTEDVFPRANKLLENMAKLHNIEWLNIAPAFADASGKMRKEITADGLHVNSEGYKIWRNAVEKYLELPRTWNNNNAYAIDSKDIVFVGNSIIAGCEWFELLNKDNVKKRSTGADIISSLSKTVAFVAESMPEKMFILSSFDKIDGSFNADSIVHSIDRSIKTIKKISPKTQVYLQGLIPVNSKFEKYASFKDKSANIVAVNERLRNIAKRNGVKWINLFPVFADDNGELKAEYTNDGFHLMGNAYVAWKDLILKYIR